MISGTHVIVYSKNAEADRAFFRDVLEFKSVDAGHGWLIFALPPAEAAFHPSDENGVHELYFMCDDLKAEMASLAKKDVKCSEVQEARWGSITKMRLPGGGEVGLYQPKHPTALKLKPGNDAAARLRPQLTRYIPPRISTAPPKINLKTVARFSSPEKCRPLTSFATLFSTKEPQKHHHEYPLFLKTPSKNTKTHH